MFESLRGINWQEHLPGLVRLFSTFTLLVLSLVYHFQTRNELAFAEANHQAQTSMLEEARLAQAVLSENIGDYLDYKDSGYIGDARRLEWVEVFRALAEELRLAEVKFSLEGSQLAQQYQDPFWRDDVAMRVTRMKLEMQLAHEGDLYRLLNGLRDRAPGLFSVEACTMDWQVEEIYVLSLTRLRGICELSWYTMVDITETWEEDSA